MEEVEAVKKLLNTVGELTGTVSSKLKEDVLRKTLSETLDEITKNGEMEHNFLVSELEQAKVLNTYAYILVSLYFTITKLDGVKFNNETPIMQEIKRVKEYMDRVKEAEDSILESNEKAKKNEAESEKFINRHLREPAVSSVHFQDKKEAKSVHSEGQNKHQYFKDDEKLKLAVQSSKGKKGSKSINQDRSKKGRNYGSSSTNAGTNVKSGKVSKSRK